jgi:hypothetical protein
MGNKMNVYRILMGRPEGKRPVGIPIHTWVDSIKMDLRYYDLVWTGLIWVRIGTSGGHPVSIVFSQTRAMEFVLLAALPI